MMRYVNTKGILRVGNQVNSLRGKRTRENLLHVIPANRGGVIRGQYDERVLPSRLEFNQFALKFVGKYVDIGTEAMFHRQKTNNGEFRYHGKTKDQSDVHVELNGEWYRENGTRKDLPDYTYVHRTGRVVFVECKCISCRSFDPRLSIPEGIAKDYCPFIILVAIDKDHDFVTSVTLHNVPLSLIAGCRFEHKGLDHRLGNGAFSDSVIGGAFLDTDGNVYTC